MAGETQITVVGNLTAPVELRFTPSGAAVANGTIASTPRTFDRQSNEWKDGETLFLRFSAWRELAENMAESLSVEGMAVIAQGYLKARSFETSSGERRTSYELDVQDIGPSLRKATAVVTKLGKGRAPEGGATGGPSAGAWGGSTSGGWGTPAADDEPPF